MENQINIQTQPAFSINKKQNHFVGKCSLIAGFLFAIIFAVSFIIGKYAFINMSYEDQNTLIIVGSVSLLVAMIFSIFLSFKGMRAGYFLIISTIFIYCASFTLMFSSYFSLLGNEMLFYALAFTALSMIIMGIISFLLPDKVSFSIMKIGSIAFFAYFIISLVGSLIINFTWSSTSFEVWQIVTTVLIGFIVICGTISSFYSLKKTSEFINIQDLDSKTQNKLLLIQSFSLLSSIIMVFMLILRILGLANRG